MSTIIQFGKDLVRRFSDHEVAGLAAQLAYFFLLSIFPFMIFLIALMAYLPISIEDIVLAMSRYIPSEAMDLLTSNLETKNTGLLSVGLLATLWSASNGTNAVMRAFNRAYHVQEDRSFIKSRLIAIVLTVAMFIVILVALMLPVFGKAIGVYVFSWFGVSEDFLAIWNALRWVISSTLFLLVLMSLYILAPNHHVNIRQSFIGAVFATVTWQAASLGFSFYVNSGVSNYSATYGSLGAVIILMIWFYLSGVVIILGGEINAMLRERQWFKR
ncbi:YihY/virulence factor BrkB family protein [Pontibacillus salipaludis]|uniref:YihY/virulence factor BrkB family protein n=1 Tax=Pontibacillus salipaludis TaxID=1697394 RepID=UPI0031ED073F